MRLFSQLLLSLFAGGSGVFGAAQLPGALPPSEDPAVWGCTQHPYIAEVEVYGRPSEQESSEVSSGPHLHEKVYRDALGRLRTDAFYASGLPAKALIKSSSQLKVIQLNFVTKEAAEWKEQDYNRSVRPGTWVRSALPSRKILGFDTIGVRYVREVHSAVETGRAAGTIVEEDWFAPSVCMVLERHIQTASGGSGEQQVMRVETVRRLEQREPEQSLFAVPKGYTFFDADTHQVIRH